MRGPTRNAPLTRRSHAERKAGTRAQLLRAATTIFAARGFYAASVDEIAHEASCSTGALYAHFGSKAELFLELVSARLPAWAAGYASAISGSATLEDGIRAAVAHWARLLDDEPEMWLIFFEFWSIAVRDPQLRPRFALAFRGVREAVAALLETTFSSLGVAPPLPTHQLAGAVVALADGIALQHLAETESAAPATLVAALRRLILAS
jgi:AcrR family transcriptional regulator